MGIITSILILSFLIFFHELGHFLFARYFGVRVDVFSIGFGSTIFSKKVGNTEYKLSLIPLGGYVKMKGQDDSNPMEKSYDADSYGSKTPMQRILILFGGPLFNFLLAFLLYVIVGVFGVKTLMPVIGNVQENSPAYMAGLKSGDKILQVNNIDIVSWKELGENIQNSGENAKLLILRNNEKLLVILTPKVAQAENLFREKIEKKMIGVAPRGDVEYIQYSLFEALDYGVNQTIESSKLILMGLQKLFEGVVPISEVGGVISIVQVTSEASSYGILTLFILTALISVNLGVLNLLPIPALDGGHIIFNIYELITRKVPTDAMIYRLTVGGWVVLISLMFLGLYNDINRLIG